MGISRSLITVKSIRNGMMLLPESNQAFEDASATRSLGKIGVAFNVVAIPVERKNIVFCFTICNHYILDLRSVGGPPA